MTQPDPARGTFSSRRKPSRRPSGVLLLVLLLLIGVAAAYTVLRPRVLLTNRLAAPVRITVGEASSTAGAGQTATVPLPWGKNSLVVWELVRPLSANGKPMGEAVRGSLSLRSRWGTTRGSTGARGPEGNYFAPLITNATNDLLRVTVNAGLEGAMDCGCAVRPDARRAFIGYYRLYANSTVQAKSGDRSAVFRDLGPKVITANGTIGLRFAPGDLRTP